MEAAEETLKELNEMLAEDDLTAHDPTAAAFSDLRETSAQLRIAIGQFSNVSVAYYKLHDEAANEGEVPDSNVILEVDNERFRVDSLSAREAALFLTERALVEAFRRVEELSTRGMELCTFLISARAPDAEVA
jgi:hypothetical protein